MPQFTFACFCGLHGLCGRKKKKKEEEERPQQDYETEV
ncbi:bladder cancer associated transcript 1 [Danio rerio]|uniref:Bladder cancer associated transcript 1 n=3 Tax=Danio rerio TaxID=7955 RepID=A0AB32TFW8_DANRE